VPRISVYSTTILWERRKKGKFYGKKVKESAGEISLIA